MILLNIDKNDACFSIGEFVNLCNTTRETLYHYEKQGLLFPSVNETNGYRYYCPEDYYNFMFVAHLSKIGFSLVEIKGYLEKPSLSGYLDALSTSELRLREKQEKLRLRNERTQRGFEALRKILQRPINRPQITYHEEEHYLRLPFDGCFGGKSCVICQSEHEKYAAEHGIDIQRHFLGFYSENPFASVPPKFDSLITKMNERVECDRMLSRPSGMYISMCYRGPFTSEGDASYGIIMDYLEKHRFTPLTGMFVEAAVGPFYTNDTSEYVAELSVLIE